MAEKKTDDLTIPPRSNRVQRTYSEAEIDRGLFAYALCSGNGRRAEELTARDGDPIPAGTLEGWARYRHADRYARVREEVLPKIAAANAEQMDNLLRREIELEGELIERVREEMPNLKPGDVAGALRNVAVTKSLNAEKAAILRGQPTQIVSHKSFEENMRFLREKGLLIEGDAQEVPEPLALEDETPEP